MSSRQLLAADCISLKTMVRHAVRLPLPLVQPVALHRLSSLTVLPSHVWAFAPLAQKQWLFATGFLTGSIQEDKNMASVIRIFDPADIPFTLVCSECDAERGGLE